MSEEYEPLKRYFIIEGIEDPELIAIKICIDVLDEVFKINNDPEVPRRILAYLNERLKE